MSYICLIKQTKRIEIMTTQTLNIAQISNRGNKFAIVAGNAILRKFKSVELAKADLASKRGTYEYWAASASVSVQNTKPIIIIC
jgi:uncharacterized membrane protein YcgQ (UPF0703/DUF1980 family)